MVQETVKEPRKRPSEKNSRTARKARLMESYQKAAVQKDFEVKKENFDNDLILSKLKKYLR